MPLKSILCALRPLILATSLLRTTQPFTSTTFNMCYFCSWKYHLHICTTLCVVSILETCTYAAPTLGVRAFLHPPTYIPHPLRKCSTPTLGGNTHKISIAIVSYSTYPIKLKLFYLILPSIISALKGLADL